MEIWAKDRGDSECHPVTGWIGVVILLLAKAGRLPRGLALQEYRRTCKGWKANECGCLRMCAIKIMMIEQAAILM